MTTKCYGIATTISTNRLLVDTSVKKLSPSCRGEISTRFVNVLSIESIANPHGKTWNQQN